MGQGAWGMVNYYTFYYKVLIYKVFSLYGISVRRYNCALLECAWIKLRARQTTGGQIFEEHIWGQGYGSKQNYRVQQGA